MNKKVITSGLFVLCTILSAMAEPQVGTWDSTNGYMAENTQYAGAAIYKNTNKYSGDVFANPWYEIDAGYYLPKGAYAAEMCPAGKYCEGMSSVQYNADADEGLTGSIAQGYFSTGGATSSTPSSSDCLSGQSCGKCMQDYDTMHSGTKDATGCFRTGITTCANAVPYSTISVANGVGAFVQALNNTEAPASVDYTQYQKNANTANTPQLDSPWYCITGGVTCNAGYTPKEEAFSALSTTPFSVTSGNMKMGSGNGSFNADGLGPGQFMMKSSVSAVPVALYGQVFVNTALTGNLGDTRDFIPSAVESGYNCWCRLTAVKNGSWYLASSPWVYVGTPDMSVNTLNSCVLKCTGYIAGSNSVKTALFSNVKTYACTKTGYYTHTLDAKGGEMLSPSTVYTRYGAGVYRTSAGADNMTPSEEITRLDTLPTKEGYRLLGFWAGAYKVIDENGYFTDNVKDLSEDMTWNARWVGVGTVNIIWRGVATAGDAAEFTANGTNVYQSSVTYGDDIITPQEVVTKQGQVFLGWKFVKTSSN